MANYSASDPSQTIEKDTEAYRDHIGTIRPDGKRAWIHPKKPKGRYTLWRNIVAVILLALFFGGPFVRIHGQPLLLLNIIERKFILFGFVFWPQDFYLVALGILTLIMTVVLFTSIWGRIWCGWACPQTIFLEMVFRKIEYFVEGDFQSQRQLSASPWNFRKVRIKGTKFLIFYAISFLIANMFLAYIIGTEELFKIITEPVSEHIVGFLSINLFTIVFFLVFAWFREQVCQFACPYGRFQSVLVDNDTISVTYDFKRGENRSTIGKRKKAVSLAKPQVQSATIADAMALPDYGDCIDCGACVVVCPAGIDIRNGIQLECVQCTACIDACDKMMDAVGKPRGLIRYTSYNAIKTGMRTLFKYRTFAYLTLWVLVLGLFTGLLLSRDAIETVVLRQPGMLAQKLPDGMVGNLYSAKIFNKTFENHDVAIRIPEDMGEIRPIDSFKTIEAQSFIEPRFFIALKPEVAKTLHQPIALEIWLNGKKIQEKQTAFVATGL